MNAFFRKVGISCEGFLFIHKIKIRTLSNWKILTAGHNCMQILEWNKWTLMNCMAFTSGPATANIDRNISVISNQGIHNFT